MITPLFDNVLVLPDQEKDKTISGIYLPESSEKKTNTGKVVAVGEGTTKLPMKIKIGQHVVYKQWIGTKFPYQNTDYLIVSQTDILAQIP